MHPFELLEELGIPLSLVEERGLLVYEEPGRLVVAEVGEDGREHRLIPGASVAWNAMKQAASKEGIAIHIRSAYRSVDRQFEIIRAKLDRGDPIEAVLRVSAPPGFSEHHTGRAVDVVTPACMTLDEAFGATAAFRWLREHASGFGFVLSYPPDNRHGYQYEPWHWCYSPPA